MERVLLEARRITRDYPGEGGVAAVLKGAGLVLRRGDSAAILGPPGSGKSTLLRILGFHEPPGSGDLLWQGRLVTGLAAGELPVLLLPNPDLAQLQAAGGPELLLIDDPAPALMPHLLPRPGGQTVAVATDDPEIAVWCRTIYRLKDGLLRPLNVPQI